MNIYIGDGSKIGNRIRKNHITGNVEGSSLRKHIAKSMGYELNIQQRPGGSKKTRLAFPYPTIGEKTISNYLRSGTWKYVLCPIGIEAKDFQFYAIQNLNPILNINYGSWNSNNKTIYSTLLKSLINSMPLSFQETLRIPDAQGVYLFINEIEPNNFCD